MPRINQLPVASSVAQTDVLAIDTPEKTYQVPRSVLAPAPYIATIPTGYWSGSGSDYYITVTASNVTADAMIYPFYDNASAALLNGPVWVIPADGSFTIHTSAIPSGTVTISVLLAGIVGEAQYQVLADVYSTSQIDSKIAQSTANVSTLKSGETTVGNIMCAGYNTGSGNYFDFFVPINAKGLTPISASVSSDTAIFTPTGRISFSSQPSITVMGATDNGVRLEVAYPSTQTPNICGTIYATILKIVCQ